MTTFSDSVKIGGSGVTEASAVFHMPYSFDPTSSSQVLLGYLPPNAKPLSVVSYGGATGGTNPTVDIGTLADDDGLANELDADGNSDSFAAGTGGAQINTVLSAVAATAIYGKVGASAATGGTAVGYVRYVVLDSWR